MADSALKIFGHRGCRGKPGVAENSLAAFDVALACANGIELDVFPTRDSHLVVFHDDMLEQLSSGRGPVTSHDLAELRRLKLRESPGSAVFTRDAIPTLDEVLDRVQYYRATHPGDARLADFKVCIEIKGQGSAEKVAEAIKRRLENGTDWNLRHFEVRSFDMQSLREMKARMPQLQLGVLLAGPHAPWDIGAGQLGRELCAHKDLFAQPEKLLPDNNVSITLGSLNDVSAALITEAAGNHPQDRRPLITVWTSGETNPANLSPQQQEALMHTLTQFVGRDGAFITDFPEEMAQLAEKYRTQAPNWQARSASSDSADGPPLSTVRR